MRVIAGRFRSRKLLSVPGLHVRPTPDRLRETLFNVLAPRIEGTVFVDAYAGSGAVGIEALSRGARHVVLIEKNNAALDVIRSNIESLSIAREVTVLRGNAAVLLKDHEADIAFIDPPYDQEKAYKDALSVLAESACPLVIAQHESRLILNDEYAVLKKVRVLRQGNNALSFFEPELSPS